MQKDILLKEYLQDSVHFCDFINGVLFHGEQILCPEQVEELPTELIFIKELSQKNNEGKDKVEIKTIHRFRDLTKKCAIGGDEVVIAIQNQSKVDNNMVFRIMTEDSLDYTAQYRLRAGGGLRRTDQVMMVLSVVFYHGEKPWNGPRKSDEIIQVPKLMERFRGYMLKNKILLITPWNVDVSKLTTDWKEVFGVLQRQNKEKEMKKYLEDNQEVHRNLPEETIRLMFALVGRLDYYEKKKAKGEKVELCRAFDDHYKSGRRQGRRQGRREGFNHCVFTMIRSSKEHGDSTEIILLNLQKFFQLDRIKAENYIKRYETYEFDLEKVI